MCAFTRHRDLVGNIELSSDERSFEMITMLAYLERKGFTIGDEYRKELASTSIAVNRNTRE